MHDLPPSDDEIVQAAQSCVLDGDEARAAYKEFQAAAKSGGPCEVCGWQDGDGIKTCFYSRDLGAVTHQNSEAGAMETMTPEQRSLFQLRFKILFIDAEHREQYIRKVAYWRNEALDTPFMVGFREREESKPLAGDPPYCDWIQSPWWVKADPIPEGLRAPTMQETADQGLQTAYMVHCYEPHPDCGGIQVSVGPYHFKCSKCGVECRMWEHGIDYDVG